MQAYGVSWGDRKGRRRAAIAAATASALLVPGGSFGHAAAGGSHASVLQQVIVQALPDALSKAEHAVSAAGGTITRQLGIVNGFAATVPSGVTLDKSNGVLAVTPDRILHLQGADYDPTTDVGAPAALQTATGASAYWSQGLYGQGVGVALIDSGVVDVDGLRQNVFYGPDLTPQALIPALKSKDTFGHGTMMASLIAGRTDDAARPYSDPNEYVGIAPEANLVSVKVADALGVTTESAVVAGVDWAVQHQNDNGLNIRVINLSVGIPSGRSYLTDPLAAAVERAWSYGMTVVAATGNNGASSINLPAADPYVIAVGAADGTSVASFSNTGNGSRNPDLVAPGTHLVGLRDPGSYIDLKWGGTGEVADTLFRGSGTSEATAVTSGAAALIISQHPDISPDQVKALLMGTADPLDGETTATEGAGAIDLAIAVDASVPDAQQSYRHAFGYQRFMARLWGGSWNGNVWQAPSWWGNAGGTSGSTWTGSTWTGSTWTGSSWSGSTWSGSYWSGSYWSGSYWSGSLWSGSTWSGSYPADDQDSDQG